MMRYDDEEESSEAPRPPLVISFASSPKLSLLAQASSTDIGEESDMVQTRSPQLRTSASVPFLWEEEPGKPRRPCTALINNINMNATGKCLGLPPRLQQTDFSRLVTKTPSPTTVFEGPYVQAKSVFSSLSFRFNASKRHDSFDSRSSKSPETTLQIGALFLDPPQLHHHHHHHHQGGMRRKGLFGSLGLKHKNAKVEGSEMEFGSEDNFVFSPLFVDDALSPTTTPTSDGKEVEMSSKMRRNGSFSTLSHSKSHFWATMYRRFKHAVPWKGKN